jgi:hypothetical protein
VIQIWNDESGANGHPKVKIHRLSAFSDMTFWSQLENYVASWEAHQCNLKGLPDSQDTRVGGDMMYPWGYDHAACKFTLSEIYWEPTGPYRNLDNHVGYDSGGNTCTIHDASGQHPDYKKVPGSPDCPWATEQGDTITFTKTGEGLFGQTVIAGPPPAGDFVPAGSVGLGYTSPGYQP